MPTSCVEPTGLDKINKENVHISVHVMSILRKKFSWTIFKINKRKMYCKMLYKVNELKFKILKFASLKLFGFLFNDNFYLV